MLKCLIKKLSSRILFSTSGEEYQACWRVTGWSMIGAAGQIEIDLMLSGIGLCVSKLSARLEVSPAATGR